MPEIQKWTRDQANTWYAEQPWLVGCNFIPSNAINQLEMWQAATFDLETIDRELAWAADLGLNTVRVYLHDLLWHQDAAGFKARIRQYLDIADRHAIKTMFVLFDDCWHDHPQLGTQPVPRTGYHNSGWLTSPGTHVVKNPTEWSRLEDYVRDIIGTFGNDERVVIWDVYNEPGNHFLTTLSLPPVQRYAKLIPQLLRYFALPVSTAPLLKAAFTWARAVQPSQPLTCGLWYMRENLASKLNALALDLSDILTFHSYFALDVTIRLATQLQQVERALLCTEYLARTVGCTFETHLPYFKAHNIGCYNWGLVSGKTQTIYSWEVPDPSGKEPALWYHDILRPDGTPYCEEEKALLQRLTHKS
jgi:hypothetical protein